MVPQGVGDEFPRQGILGGLGKWIARLQLVAAAEPEGAAMYLIRAGPGLRRYDRREGLSEFRVIVLRGDLGFRHRFQVGVDDDDAQNRVPVIGAIELEGTAAEVLPVDVNLKAALRILARSVRPPQLLGARGKELKISEVSVEDR